MENKPTPNSQKVYKTAKSLLHQRLATNPFLGCAEAVNYIFRKALGVDIGGGASTAEMLKYLQERSRFLQANVPLAGDVIMSATGTGNGKLPHGHVGIVGHYGILSNDSESGLLLERYTLLSWLELFTEYGGMPTLFFRIK